MKRLILERICKNETGTWGVLIYNNTPFAVTGECPDICNMKNRSCIPEGSYLCKRVNSPSHGNCFEVRSVPGRSYILFHKGNMPTHDSQGCILVAESFDLLYGQEAVTNSTHGYNEFMKLLERDKEFHLAIK